MFLKALLRGQAEFVNGSRLVYPMRQHAMKFANTLGNKAFARLFSFLLDQRIKDTLCGTKVLWRKDWVRMERNFGGWGIKDLWGDYELLLGAGKLNIEIIDVPVHYQERIYGSTKMNKVFANGIRMFLICFHAWLRVGGQAVSKFAEHTQVPSMAGGSRLGTLRQRQPHGSRLPREELPHSPRGADRRLHVPRLLHGGARMPRNRKKILRIKDKDDPQLRKWVAKTMVQFDARKLSQPQELEFLQKVLDVGLISDMPPLYGALIEDLIQMGMLESPHPPKGIQ